MGAALRPVRVLELVNLAPPRQSPAFRLAPERLSPVLVRRHHRLLMRVPLARNQALAHRAVMINRRVTFIRG
jgi:hypothetical protein